VKVRKGYRVKTKKQKARRTGSSAGSFYRGHKIVAGGVVCIGTISTRDSGTGLKSRLLDATIREVVLKSLIIYLPPSDHFLLDF